MIPARNLYLFLAMLGLVALSAVIAGPASLPWLIWPWLTALLLLSILIDAIQVWRQPLPIVHRELPAALAVNFANPITLQLRAARPDQQLMLADHHPGDDHHTALPATLQADATGKLGYRYHYQPSTRGHAHFGDIEVWLSSPFQCWLLRRRIKTPMKVPVYPDFSRFMRHGLQQASNQLVNGKRLRHRAGEGQEFHQLREYRNGDSPRQIDWKATARRQQLISREYREQNNQPVIFLLDGSQRLALRSDQNSSADSLGNMADTHSSTAFDHALQTILLLANQALSLGDHPGLLVFSQQKPLWLPPVRGPHAMHQLLRQLYPAHPTAPASDFSQAARTLLQRYRRRALIIMLTCLQPDDDQDLLKATSLLSPYHRLMVGNLQLPLLQKLHRSPVSNLQQALTLAAASRFEQEQQQLVTRLRHAGVRVVSGQPETLPARLYDSYIQWRL